MRFVSFILLICIVFLSSFGGMVKPAQPKMMHCCKKAKAACHHAPAERKSGGGGCDEPACNMMFSCGLCGFIVKGTVRLKSLYAYSLPKPVAHYIIGDAAGYYSDNWKPPQPC